MITVSVFYVHQLVSKVLDMWRWVQMISQWVIFLMTVTFCQLCDRAIGPAISLHSISSNKTSPSCSTHTQFEIDCAYCRKSAVLPHSDTEVLLRQQAQGSSEETDASDVRVMAGPSIYIEQACGEPQGQQLVVDFSEQAADHEREVEIENHMYDAPDSSVESESTEITSESEVEFISVRGQGDCRKPRGLGALGRGHTNAGNETESSVEPAVHRSGLSDVESSSTDTHVKSQVFYSSDSIPISVPESASIGTATLSLFEKSSQPLKLAKPLNLYIPGESEIEITTLVHTYTSDIFRRGFGNKGDTMVQRPIIAGVSDSDTEDNSNSFDSLKTLGSDPTTPRCFKEQDIKVPKIWEPHKYEKHVYMSGESQIEVTTGIHTYASEYPKLGVGNKVLDSTPIKDSTSYNEQKYIKVPKTLEPNNFKKHVYMSGESQIEVTTGIHTYASEYLKSDVVNKVPDSMSAKDKKLSSFEEQEHIRVPKILEPNNFKKHVYMSGESQIEVTTGIHTYASEYPKFGVGNNMELTVHQAIIEESNCLRDNSHNDSLKPLVPASTPKTDTTSAFKEQEHNIRVPKIWEPNKYKKHVYMSGESQIEVTTGIHTYASDNLEVDIVNKERPKTRLAPLYMADNESQIEITTGIHSYASGNLEFDNVNKVQCQCHPLCNGTN